MILEILYEIVETTRHAHDIQWSAQFFPIRVWTVFWFVYKIVIDNNLQNVLIGTY